MIELQSVSLERNGKRVLGPLDLDLNSGEVVAVIGANGAGKSTLLAVLSGLARGYRGSVRIGGRCLREITADVGDFARKRAVMPQFHPLAFDFSVREVVALGRAPHRSQEKTAEATDFIDEAMALAAVTELENRRYTQLSGGQQARVQFARVLAQLSCGYGDACLLLLDEPTASLDLRHQLHLMESARTLAARGVTVVAVLHDINLAARAADRIAILHEGRLLALGSPREVIDSKLLQTAFDAPVHVLANALPGRLLVAV